MPPIREIVLFLIDPWLFMFQSLTYLPSTIFRLLIAGDLFSGPLVSSFFRLQAAWFGAFWSVAGPGVRQTGEARVVPLFEGRVKHGRILRLPDDDEADGSGEEGGSTGDGGDPRPCHLRGTVLEVGPGTGMWVSLFADTQLSISKIYGVEPNNDVHKELRQRVVAAGLSDRYEIVPRGIEELATWGQIAPGSLDCIVSILCLCSIPEPEKNIRELFQYLKPGGTWLVYEHVRCESKRLRKSGLFMRRYQGGLHLLASLSRPLPRCLEPSYW